MLKTIFRKIQNRNEIHYSGLLSKALSSLSPAFGLKLLDIGAAGDIEPRWKRITPFIDYFGVEPDARSRKILLTKPPKCKSYTLLDKAIWNLSGSIDFKLCKKPQASSHFVPNATFLKRFSDHERFDVIGTETIKTVCLDDLKLNDIDFIKLDIQGGELAALEQGKNTLQNTLGLEIEVEFLHLYLDQPLFGDLVTFLTSEGFEFIDFVNLCRWNRSTFDSCGQCVFGDSLFLRSPENLVTTQLFTLEKLEKYIGICLLYKRFDLIERVLFLSNTLYPEWSLSLKENRNISKLKELFLSTKKTHHAISSIVRLFDPDARAHLIY